MNRKMIVVPNMVVKSNDMVNTGSAIAGDVPPGSVTMNRPTGIVGLFSHRDRR